MQLGFVIDHSRCIGCHACTVACKSENEVPVGSFRTWVKYTEEGTFPEVKRSFAVLRCNQCTDAPCVSICPVTAIHKRADGIVDIDPEACIGCKACMHGCPYDAIYINPDTGTAEKCHFCAHRTELGLAPACAVVCPTEAIIPGDFEDEGSLVSRLVRDYDLTARKTEAGTGPNVFYREVAEAGIDPTIPDPTSGYIWSNRVENGGVDAATWAALEEKADARTVYDVPRKMLWGGKITGYLFTKSIAAGLFPAAWLALGTGVAGAVRPGLIAPLLSLFFLALTGGLLVADLKRPDRFLKILLRPNWDSWLARGTFAIAAYSLLLTVWLALGLLGYEATGAAGTALGVVTIALGALTAAYTGWLFAQAKGRVLWMKRGYWLHLIVQAALAGSAVLLALQPLLEWSDPAFHRLRDVLLFALVSQILFMLAEHRMAPKGREKEYARTVHLVTHGPFATRHWILGFIVGCTAPIALLALQAGVALAAVAGVLALVGLWVEEDVFVRAGQTLPIS